MILIYSLVAEKYINHFLGLKSLFVIANTLKHFLVFLFMFKKAFITFAFLCVFNAKNYSTIDFFKVNCCTQRGASATPLPRAQEFCGSLQL